MCDPWKELVERGYAAAVQTIERAVPAGEVGPPANNNRGSASPSRGVRGPQPFISAQTHWELYTKMHRYITSHEGNEDIILYAIDRHKQFLSQFIGERVITRLQAASESALQYLQTLVALWDQYSLLNEWLYLVFKSLDRLVVLSSQETLQDTGIFLFYRSVLTPERERIAQAIREVMSADRPGQSGDAEGRKAVGRVCQGLDPTVSALQEIYESIESAMAASLHDFYTHWNASEEPCTDPIRDCFQWESLRFQQILRPQSQQRMLAVVLEDTLLHGKSRLLDDPKGFARSLATRDEVSLLVFFELFHRLDPELRLLCEALRRYIDSRTRAASEERRARVRLQDRHSDDAFVDRLLTLHEEIQSSVPEAFREDINVQAALRDAFVAVMRVRIGNYSNSELLCSYMDHSISLRSAQPENLQRLMLVIDLLLMVDDKDQLIALYQKHLSYRLLLPIPFIETETLLLRHLTDCCGHLYTAKLEGMVMDVEGSLARADASAASHYIVCNSLHWPSPIHVGLALPVEVLKLWEHFKRLFEGENAHKVLQLVPSLCFVTMQGVWKSGTYSLCCSFLQACVLLLFNAAPSIPFARVSRLLGSDFALKVVRPLLQAPTHLLVRRPDSSGALSDSDLLVVNEGFSSVSNRVVVPYVRPLLGLSRAHQSPLDRSVAPRSAEYDRSSVTDAIITRYMKQQRAERQEALVVHICGFIELFKAEEEFVLKRVENLIDRDYLERDEGNPAILRYVA